MRIGIGRMMATSELSSGRHNAKDRTFQTKWAVRRQGRDLPEPSAKARIVCTKTALHCIFPRLDKVSQSNALQLQGYDPSVEPQVSGNKSQLRINIEKHRDSDAKSAARCGVQPGVHLAGR